MPLTIAFVLSALLHAAAITMPGWDLPGQFEPPPPLETRLPSPVAEVAKAKPAPRPRSATRKPAVPAVPVAPVVPADAATAAAEAQAHTPGPADEPPPLPAAESPADKPAQALPVSAPATPPWPRGGRVRYIVTYGLHGFVIGESVHEWSMRDAGYTIRTVFEPKGLAVLRGRMRRQESVGELTASGLRPREFRDQREGRELETAVFDWPAARVLLSSARGTAPLTDGTQDLLSVFYQLAWQAPRETVNVAVATASRVRHWTFEWLGEEAIQVETKELTALHLRTAADGDVTEVWLAPALGGLPVKIRHVDRSGDVFEQSADLMEFD